MRHLLEGGDYQRTVPILIWVPMVRSLFEGSIWGSSLNGENIVAMLVPENTYQFSRSEDYKHKAIPRRNYVYMTNKFSSDSI